MDIGDTIAPDSDQLDAVDLRSSGPQTFTVARVVVKRGDQPVDVHLAEFPRPWRPGKSMRRVLDTLWGPSAGGAYEGRKVTLFCDDRVKFGGEAIGGVRVSHMSHIGDTERGVPLIVGRGNVKTYKVKPLVEDAPVVANADVRLKPEPTAEQVAATTDRNELQDMWRRSGPERRAQIETRVTELPEPPEG